MRAPGERTEARSGHRAGNYSRGLVTRIGKLELRVPRNCEGRFSTELFKRQLRPEKALVSALAETHVQGLATRKVEALTEEPCGHAFSASTISQINKGRDAALARFANRPLVEICPYPILGARPEKVGIDGVIGSQAALVAVGINWEGRRRASPRCRPETAAIASRVSRRAPGRCAAPRPRRRPQARTSARRRRLPRPRRRRRVTVRRCW